MLSNESVGNVNLDKISQLAGLTKKSIYYHFPSKDHLLTAAVDHLRPTYLEQYRVWAERAGENAQMHDRVLMILKGLSQAAEDPHWKGCCFVRVAAELGSLPGHPARKMVARAIREMETWFELELAAEGCNNPLGIARLLVILLNGVVVTLLVHRNGPYSSEAIELLDTILPAKH
jgi:AcrR family transcriptional regulator